MANTITLKRSASAGKVPLATDLQLGELAVNTNDGRLYLKKDNGTPSIVEVGPVTSVAGRTGAVALTISDVAGAVTSVAGRTGAVALAIPDVADLATSLIPVGAVIPFAGVSAPAKWLFCFGQNVSRSSYAALFSAISTTYGAGNGSTTFTLPDLRGRVVAGQDDMGGASANRLTDRSGGLDGDVLGDTGGAETHTLTTAEIPAHTHGVGGGEWAFLTFTGAGGLATTPSGTSVYAQQATDPTGGGGAHNNIQPTMILNYMIYAGA